MRVGVTIHGAKRLHQRMGRGCDPYQVARRCWKRDEAPPPEWEVPHVPMRRYLRYGDCVFVYGPPPHEHFTGTFSGDFWLVTVVGPFRPGQKWESKRNEL